VTGGTADERGFARLENLSGAFAASRVLHAAVKLDLFAAVGNGATAGQVAAARRLDARACELLLNAMAALELLEKRDGRFALTAASRRWLLPDSPRHLGGMVEFEAASWPLWERLEEAVRGGQPVRTPDMYQNDPAEARRFILAMHSLVRARGDDRWVAENLPLEGACRLLDVGSGPATYPMAMARAHPGLECQVFDLPATLSITREVLAAEGMSERIALHTGDYHTDPLPDGFDLVFLSNVLHGEDADACQALLHRCAAALKPGGRVVIKDHIMDRELVRPTGGAVFSLMMLLTTRGRDYGRHEYAAWLQAAGMEAPTEMALPSPPFSSSLLISRKPG